MAYRSRLEARVARHATRAIVEFGLVEDGDRVMVGLSGGKDSWALLQILDVLRRHAKIQFSLIAVTVDSGYEDFDHQQIAQTCGAREWEHRIEHTRIGETIDDLLEPGDTPCSLCGRLRRGVLYRVANEIGATKIALGHHADDVIETLLLNLFYEGTLKAMPARLVSDSGHHVVVRPLVYVRERDTAAYARERGLPILSCCCSACGDFRLKRQRIKRLLLDLERENPGIRNSMLRAVGNVVASHLLDPTLLERAGDQVHAEVSALLSAGSGPKAGSDGDRSAGRQPGMRRPGR